MTTNLRDALLKERADLQLRLKAIEDILSIYSPVVSEIEPKKEVTPEVKKEEDIVYSNLEVKDILRNIKDFFVFNPETEFSVLEVTNKINAIMGVNIREHVVHSALQHLFYGSFLRKNKYGPKQFAYFLPKEKRKKGERMLGFTRPNQGIGDAVKELLVSTPENKAMTEKEVFDLLQATDFPKLLDRTLRNTILSLLSTKQIREKDGKYYGR